MVKTIRHDRDEEDRSRNPFRSVNPFRDTTVARRIEIAEQEYLDMLDAAVRVDPENKYGGW